MADQVAPIEVIASRPLMRDYWAKFRWRTYVVITSSQCTVMLLILGLMELFQITHLGWAGFFVVALIGSAILNTVTIALVHMIGKPFRDLVQAIVMVAGEPSSKTPPNPNNYENQNDGFKEILQTIYEMSARNQLQPVPVATIDSTIMEGLEEMQTGLAIINSAGEIAYHNDSAPVRIGTDSKPLLDLLFPEDDTLTSWLTKKVKNKLTA